MDGWMYRKTIWYSCHGILFWKASFFICLFICAYIFGPYLPPSL
jgi:hypothetical protein